MTMDGAVIGTLEYMAPEQARAEPVDQRADIYAFGLIMYDMLAGRSRGAVAKERGCRTQSADGTGPAASEIVRS